MIDDRPHLEVATRAELRSWLDTNHAASNGVWLITWKRSSERPGPTYDEIVEECLCFGWIDSRPGTLDATRSKRLITPRRRGSGWSAVNKRRVAELEARGALHAAGISVIEAARADGSWSSLDESEARVVPADLAAAFSRHPGSADHFAAFPPGEQRRILQWIGSAKTPPTRERRIEETARLAAAGERANVWRPRTA